MGRASAVADVCLGRLDHAVDDDRVGQHRDDLVAEHARERRDVVGLGRLGERGHDLVARDAQRDRAVFHGEHRRQELADLADGRLELEVDDPHAGELAERVEDDLAQVGLTLDEDHAERDVVLGRLHEVGGHLGLRDEGTGDQRAGEAPGPLGAGGTRDRAHMTTRRTSSRVVRP